LSTISYDLFLELYTRDMLNVLIPANVNKSEFWSFFLSTFEKSPLIFSSLMPKAKEILQELKRIGLKIGVITGRLTSQDKLKNELVYFGIYRFIDALATRLAAGGEFSPKTKMRTLCIVMARLKVKPEKCAVVGDYHEDMIAARELGALPIGVLSGLMSSESLKKAGARFIINDISELPLLIKQYIELKLEANEASF